MKRTYKIIPLILVTGLGACGKKKSDDAATTTEAETKTQKISNGMEDATDAVGDNSSSDTAKSLTAADTDILISRSCSRNATDGTVSVTLTGSGTGVRTAKRGLISYTTTFIGSGTEVRKWTPVSGQTIDCNSTKEYVSFNYFSDAAVNGLKTSITVDKSRSVTVTATGTKRNGDIVSKTKKAGATTKGTRTITWGLATASDSSKYVARTHTIESSVTRTKTFTNDSGNDDTIETTVKTVSSNPMIVTVERASTGGTLSSKTVNSGSLRIAKTGEAATTQLDFTNVKYDYSSETICVPTSGTIKAQTFADATSTTATSTCTIKFGESVETYSTGISITCDGGTTLEYSEYNTKGCDMEREK